MESQPRVAESVEQAATQRKRCGAKNRPGAKHATCHHWALPGRERCARHGGRTPRGSDSPHFRHGNRQRIPGKNGKRVKWPGLDELVAQAAADPELARFKMDMAILEGMKRQMTGRLNPDKPTPASVQTRIMALIDMLRKVKEAENRRLRDLQLVVSVERHIAALRLIGEVQHVVLVAVADELRAWAIRQGVPEGEAKRTLDPVNWALRFKRSIAAAAAHQPALVIDVKVDDDARGGGS